MQKDKTMYTIEEIDELIAKIDDAMSQDNELPYGGSCRCTFCQSSENYPVILAAGKHRDSCTGIRLKRFLARLQLAKERE